MTKDAIKVLVANILVKDSIDQDAGWSQEDLEEEVVEVGEGQAACKSTAHHVGGQHQKHESVVIEERLSRFGDAQLDHVAVLEQQIADSRKVLEGHIRHGLQVRRLGASL